MNWDDTLLFDPMSKAYEELTLVMKHRSSLTKKSHEVEQAVLFKLSRLLFMFIKYVSHNEKAAECDTFNEVFNSLVEQQILFETDNTVFDEIISAHEFFFEGDLNQESWHSLEVSLIEEQSYENCILEHLEEYCFFFENFLAGLPRSASLESAIVGVENARA